MSTAILALLVILSVGLCQRSIESGKDGNYLYTLKAQAFINGKPGVLVHVPPSFTASSDKWNLVFFFHGHKNCVANIALEGPVGRGCGKGARTAMSLIKSFDQANINALLIVPELAYDIATSNPGALGKNGGFRAFMEELLSASALGAVLSGASMDKIGAISLMSHSGGYWATAMILRHGGVSGIRQVVLFDSLYGYAADFTNWVRQQLTMPDCRFQFVDIYSGGGGTLKNSQAMATTVSRLSGMAASAFLSDKRATTNLPADAMSKLVFFKYSSLSHDQIPRIFFPAALAEFANGFPACSLEGAMLEDEEDSSLAVPESSSAASSSEMHF